VVGLAFFLLAGLMPLRLQWAGLEFGILWGLILSGLGLHLRKLGRAAQEQVANTGLKAEN
jgi:hypothetical protein